MIGAIALDDEPLALKVLEAFCKKSDLIDLQKTFTSPNEAQKFLIKQPVDLLFLDIHLSSVNGIDFYRSIKQPAAVIFTTAFSEYAVEGFNLNAIDYLLKPFTFERFLQALEKLNTTDSVPKKETYLFIRADYSLVKIHIPDILYIEGLDDYLKIHIKNKKTVVARMTMKAIIEKLSQQKFIRIHRSFIVPLDKVDHVKNKIIFINGIELPIGSSYEPEVMKLFSGK